jgi:hypothetical protein
MNQDFAEMLGALCDQKAEFLVVGAYAMAAHGFPRATGDIAWDQRLEIMIQGRTIPVLGKDDLIHNKVSTGRPKDLGDVEALKKG